MSTTARYERKLVEGYKRELVEAEESLNKVRVDCVSDVLCDSD
jgi:hypothetical protein